MEKHSNIQEMFFERIKSKLDANYSLVHEISEALGISYDSAYRRLRGEKQLSLEETSLLSQKFSISLDTLMNHKSNFQSFSCYHVEPEQFCGSSWLSFVKEQLHMLEKLRAQRIIYAAKAPPIFNYFQFPEVAGFKFLFWEKTLFRSAEFKHRQFSIEDIDNELIEKCKEIARLSLKIPITEIWNEDTFRILIRQVEYYWVSNYFKSKDDLFLLLEKIEEWLKHNKKEAEYGMRFLHNQAPKGVEGSYQLYENEIVINDNSILVELPNSCVSFLTYNVLGLLGSQDAKLCKGLGHFYKVIISKSNLISSVGEKERNRFFNKLQGIIDHFKETYFKAQVY